MRIAVLHNQPSGGARRALHGFCRNLSKRHSVHVFRLSSAAQHPYGSAKYGSRYQGQRGPTPSRSAANFHRTQI